MRKIGLFYDKIWAYGPPDFYDPLTGLDVPPAVEGKDEVRRLPATEPVSMTNCPATGRRATISSLPPAAAATAPN